MKKIEIIFEENAYEEYDKLKDFVVQNKSAKKKPTYEQLLTSINSAIKNLKANPYYGDLIPRRNISKGVKRRYGTDKILRIELVGYWRLLYTIVGEEVKIIAFILEFMNHKKYNKIFGYKKN